jgi:hypothetical protein
MKKKIMLIAGCSHAAGAEVDGNEDSAYNRQHSFGNVLGDKLGRQNINIASSGSTNSTIARSVLEWFAREYNSETMDVFVVVGWTESSRLELPVDNREAHYEINSPSIDWISQTGKSFIRINQGWTGADAWEREILPGYQKFIAENLTYLEIVSANLVLQLQYFFKMHGVEYVMCNTMHMFERCKPLQFYLTMIDATRYINFDNNDNCFYWKYRNAGYTNPKAKYWHHNETPHSLYAEELLTFISSNNYGTPS